jgi:hypothetical protein
LLKLRPVSFRYNNDPTAALQYGLVAEEVAKIYPELVLYGADGKVQTVRYSMLTALLLNELDKRTRENQQQTEQLQRPAKQIGRLTVQVAEDQAATQQMAESQAGNQRELRGDAGGFPAASFNAGARNRHWSANGGQILSPASRKRRG